MKIHPTDVNKVVAGSNGPGSGQIMWYSTNGGTAWTQAAALPQGSTCCDPTVDWSSNGQYAYTSTLGGCGALCNVWVYRSADGGATWNDLATITPGDGRREVTSAGTSDKQYIHVDKFATSPVPRQHLSVLARQQHPEVLPLDRLRPHLERADLTMSTGSTQSGIGCDLTTDKNGNLYYFWPATNGQTILMRKSTNGGTSFATAVTVANTQDGYDFAIPAMETRRAFIYASADADLSNGAFANSIYVAWTDTTAARVGNNRQQPRAHPGRLLARRRRHLDGAHAARDGRRQHRRPLPPLAGRGAGRQGLRDVLRHPPQRRPGWAWTSSTPSPPTAATPGRRRPA